MEASTQEPFDNQSHNDIAVLESRSQLGYRLRNFYIALRRSPVGVMGAIIVGVFLLLAIVGPAVAPHDPLGRNLRARFEPPGFSDDTGLYILGTDQLGRDILSRILAGARVSVIVGVVAVIIAGSIGVMYGLIAGFVGGWVDALMMRIADALLGIPFIILVVAISGIVGAGLTTLILILGLTGWVTYSRVIRGEVLKVREMEYVTATRAMGQREYKIMLRHILPNVISSAIILAAASSMFR